MSRSNIAEEMCVKRQPLAVPWDMPTGIQTERLKPGKSSTALLSSGKQWKRWQRCWARISTDSNVQATLTCYILHLQYIKFALDKEKSRNGGRGEGLENCTWHTCHLGTASASCLNPQTSLLGEPEARQEMMSSPVPKTNKFNTET